MSCLYPAPVFFKAFKSCKLQEFAAKRRKFYRINLQEFKKIYRIQLQDNAAKGGENVTGIPETLKTTADKHDWRTENGVLYSSVIPHAIVHDFYESE